MKRVANNILEKFLYSIETQADSLKVGSLYKNLSNFVLFFSCFDFEYVR